MFCHFVRQMCAKGATMSAKAAIMSAKDATMSAKVATVSAKVATVEHVNYVQLPHQCSDIRDGLQNQI